jgi:FkbM family methyltransferase
MGIKSRIRQGLHKAYRRPEKSAQVQEIPFDKLRQHYLQKHDIGLVVDVGANEGQYAAGIWATGYTGTMVSFEPVMEVFKKLEENQHACEARWLCLPLALGAQNGAAVIHIAGNNAESSSILPMLSSHTDALPQSAYVGEQQVEVVTLDHCFEQYAALQVSDALWLKIDTQGTELDILKGASRLLSSARMIEMELSFCTLYAQQPLIETAIAELRSLGFVPVYMEPCFTNGPFKQLQMSGLFEKNNA